MSKIFYERKGIKNEKLMDLGKVYSYWRSILFERLMRMFVWDNLPFPQRELEYRLLKSGAALVVHDAKAGIMTTQAALSGVTVYDDIFTKATYDAPTAEGGTVQAVETLLPIQDNIKLDDVKAVYGYNNSLHQSLQPHVDYYASLLAHGYLTIKMAMVNLRAQDILAATDDNTKESIKAWHNGLYEGKMLAIFDDTLSELPTSIQNLSSNNHNLSIPDLLESQNEILRCFFRDIGIRYTKEKRGNMVVDEVSSDDMMLLYNVDDLLYCRQQLVDVYNQYIRPSTKPKIDVRLNPIFEKIRERGDNNNDDIDVSDQQPN